MPVLQRLRVRWAVINTRGKTIILISYTVAALAAFAHHAFNKPIPITNRLHALLHAAHALPVERTCQDIEPDPQSSATPKPLIILVSGGARTGTTYLYNLVRILLRQRDPNTISGWYEDLSYAAGRYATPDPPSSPILDRTSASSGDYNVWNGALDAYRNTGTTVLVKVHLLAHATRLFTGCDGPKDIAAKDCPIDLVILSHRDLCSQIASLRRMGWGTSINRGDVLSSPSEYCRKRKDPAIGAAPGLTNEEWSNAETWVTQAHAMAACHEQWLIAAGEKLAVDVPTGGADIGLAEKLIKRIEETGGDDRLASGTFRTDAKSAIAEADALRPLACASHLAVNPITHLHRGHVVVNSTVDSSDGGSENEAQQHRDEDDRDRGCAAIDADPSLRDWQKRLRNKNE